MSSGWFFFNQDDLIFHGRKGAREDSYCIYLGVSQVAGVKVAGCHIGLELLARTFIGDRCDAGIEEATPRFGVGNVAEHLPNLGSIVSLTYSDSWGGDFFSNYPVPESWTSGSKCMRPAGSLFKRKWVVSAISRDYNSAAFRDYLRFLIGRAKSDCTRWRLLFLRSQLQSSEAVQRDV